jgi:hypothetical protein
MVQNVTQGPRLGKIFDCGYGPVVDHFEHDDESFSSIKGKEFH